MNKRLTSALWLSTLLAAGCSFIPQFDQPNAPVPGLYPTTTESSASTAAADIPWEQFFTDQRLQQLITLGLENNRDLRIAVLNIEQARAQYQIQRSAEFPELGIAGTGSRAANSQSGGYVNTYMVGLSMPSWEIDFWGRIRSLKEQSLARYLATEEGRKSAQISLIASIAHTWLGLQADEELRAISQRTLQTREESVRLAKLRFDAGATSELDFQQTRALTESARATLAQQTRQRDLAINALTLLLGQQVPAELLASLQGKQLVDLPVLADVPAGRLLICFCAGPIFAKPSKPWLPPTPTLAQHVPCSFQMCH